jgi:hypothetical protein
MSVAKCSGANFAPLPSSGRPQTLLRLTDQIWSLEEIAALLD